MTLSDYTDRQEIGRGGTGIVYKAKDRLGRIVAIKVLQEDLSDDKRWKERFEREATVLSRLQHENIVKLFAFEQDQESKKTFWFLSTLDPRL